MDRFQNLFDNAHDGILIASQTTRRLIMANPSIGRQLGYTPDELTALGVEDIHPAAELPRILREFDLLAQGDQEIRQNVPMLRKDGQIFLADISAARIILNGEPCLVGFFRDVTIRVRREQEERSRADRYQALLELSRLDMGDLMQLARFTLEKIVLLTGSQVGLFGFLNQDESEMTIQAWSHGVMTQCAIQERPLVYPIDQAGLWGEAVRQRRTITVNDYPTAPGKRGLPIGHLPLSRLISHPVFKGERIIALAVVANKPTDYTEEDGSQLSLVGLALLHGLTQYHLEKSRLESEERFRSLAESATDGIVSIDQEGRIRFWNRWAERIFQFSREEVLGQPVQIIIPHRYEEAHLAGFRLALSSGRISSQPGNLHSVFGQRKDGEEVPLEMTLSSCTVNNQIMFTAVLRDVTARKQLEEQLRHSSKMEAIGTLAGGIAHDVNNILAIILGNVELGLLGRHEAGQAFGNIRDAALRGRDLVRQLLTFGRRSRTQKQRVNPVPMVREVLKLMRATLPTTIAFREQIRSEELEILIDPTQWHQILVNLCTNAGQVMGEKGGVLEVAMEPILLTPEVAQPHGVDPGRFLQLTVRDTGPGIDPRHLDRLFEPFFTTKEEGRGSGLGLAVVYGAVRESQGAILVESALGQGATFRVMLPVVEPPLVPAAERSSPSPSPDHGSGRILFIDDEPDLVKVGVRMLETLGYTAVEATDSREALSRFLANPEEFDAVITDQTMPGLTGEELAVQLLQLRPRLPILLCTGFSEKMTEERALAIGFRGFFLKPVTLNDLARAVRLALAPVVRLEEPASSQ